MRGRRLYAKNAGAQCPNCAVPMHLYEHAETPGLLQVCLNCNPSPQALGKNLDTPKGHPKAHGVMDMKAPKDMAVVIKVDDSEALPKLRRIRREIERIHGPSKIQTIEVLLAVNIIFTIINTIIILWRTS